MVLHILYNYIRHMVYRSDPLYLSDVLVNEIQRHGVHDRSLLIRDQVRVVCDSLRRCVTVYDPGGPIYDAYVMQSRFQFHTIQVVVINNFLIARMCIISIHNKCSLNSQTTET